MKIKDLRDVHKGEVIFLVGGAPSCNSWNVNLIKDYTTIAVNSGLVKLSKNATYFLSDDQGVRHWSYFQDLLPKLNTTNLLYEDKLKEHSQHLNQERTIYFSHKSFFSPPDIYNFSGIKLTKEEPIIGTRLSTGSAIHVSFIMGAKVCVLLGCDCRGKDGHRYFFQYWDKKKQPYRLDYDFNKRTQDIGASYKDFVDYWKHFSENNKEILENEFKVINCSDTPSGFDFFPKMSIEEVLERYGDKK